MQFIFWFRYDRSFSSPYPKNIGVEESCSTDATFQYPHSYCSFRYLHRTSCFLAPSNRSMSSSAKQKRLLRLACDRWAIWFGFRLRSVCFTTNFTVARVRTVGYIASFHGRMDSVNLRSIEYLLSPAIDWRTRWCIKCSNHDVWPRNLVKRSPQTDVTSRSCCRVYQFLWIMVSVTKYLRLRGCDLLLCPLSDHASAISQ